MPRKKDIDKMREWFFEHYDDPANLLPYDSGEGGYIPIYGSLDYTDDILYGKFSGIYKDKIIQELIDELGDGDLWSPRPDETWYDGPIDGYLLISDIM